MLLMQNILCDVYSFEKESDRVNVAALVYPDAVRAYGIQREVTHFEQNSQGEPSYWSYPTDMIMYSDSYMISNHMDVFGKLVDNYVDCAVGESTVLGAFYEHNQHLPKMMYDAIERHLKQDIIFDDWLRKYIDCYVKYLDDYNVSIRGSISTVNGEEVRKIINEIEQQGIYVLAYEIFKKTGVVTNKKWFDENVYPVLRKEYTEGLCNHTYSQMIMNDRIDDLITKKDWSRIDKVVYGITYSDYKSLYNDIRAYVHGFGYENLPSKMVAE